MVCDTMTIADGVVTQCRTPARFDDPVVAEEAAYSGCSLVSGDKDGSSVALGLAWGKETATVPITAPITLVAQQLVQAAEKQRKVKRGTITAAVVGVPGTCMHTTDAMVTTHQALTRLSAHSTVQRAPTSCCAQCCGESGASCAAAGQRAKCSYHGLWSVCVRREAHCPCV